MVYPIYHTWRILTIIGRYDAKFSSKSYKPPVHRFPVRPPPLLPRLFLAPAGALFCPWPWGSAWRATLRQASPADFDSLPFGRFTVPPPCCFPFVVPLVPPFFLRLFFLPFSPCCRVPSPSGPLPPLGLLPPLSRPCPPRFACALVSWAPSPAPAPPLCFVVPLCSFGHHGSPRGVVF